MKLDELKSLCDKATPGPWEVYRDGVRQSKTGKERYIPIVFDGEIDEDDAGLIAAARSALAKLIAVAEAADAFVDGMEAQDMGFALPSSIEKAPGSYWDLLNRYRAARAALEAS